MRTVVEDALREMPQGTHAVLVYDSKENKRDVLFNHLNYGARKAGLVYVCSEETPKEIETELQGFGLDVPGLRASGDLSVQPYEDVYIKDGSVDTPKIARSFADKAWEYKAKGRDGIRAAAEMSCFFRERKTQALLEYENYLHRNLSFPGRGLCAYNIVEMGNSGNLELLWPILRAHALVIMTGPGGSFALEPEKVTRSIVGETEGELVPALARP